jgi:hypothetical protein
MAKGPDSYFFEQATGRATQRIAIRNHSHPRDPLNPC